MKAAFLTATPLSSSRFTSSTCSSLQTTQFSPRRPFLPVSASRQTRALWLMKVGIYFASTTGNTQQVAEMIQESYGDDAEEPKDIDDAKPDELKSCDTIIVGAPTWNTGADTERSGTGWDEFIYGPLADLDLSGKPVAVFGLGDAVGYSDYFCDALEEIHDAFEKSGAKMIGYTGTDHVEFEESKSVRDGKFLGMAVDMVNGDTDEIEELISNWCNQIKEESKVAATA